MATKEENELLSRVGPGTPMGELLRQYWIPVTLSEELAEPDSPPQRVRLLGETALRTIPRSVSQHFRQTRLRSLTPATPSTD